MSSKNYKEAKQIIDTLNKGNFYCKCPCECGEIRLKDAGLFYLDEFTPEAWKEYKIMQEEIKKRRQKLNKKIPLLSK